ncbi:TPA: hypothetical protein ACH3X3_004247 [Trebouxia sp. C0006]
MHVGHARELLEQQLAEAQQHVTAQEEEVKKAKEEASTTESAAASRAQEHLKTMAQLNGVSESYSRCRADLDSATRLIKGLEKDLEKVRGELDSAHREAIDTAAKTQAKIKEVENEARSMVTTQVQANKLPTEEKLLQLELHAKQAQQAQRDAEKRAQLADLKDELQALRDKLAEKR